MAEGRSAPFQVLVLNQVSKNGLDRLPAGSYVTGTDIVEPDAILLRSADLHKREIPPSVVAIARAGAGTNNIPVPAMSARGVPVFNAPGANANAVKELVLAGMLMAARNLAPARAIATTLAGISRLCRSADRRRIASGSTTSVPVT